jgi:hypothetical protein
MNGEAAALERAGEPRGKGTIIVDDDHRSLVRRDLDGAND